MSQARNTAHPTAPRTGPAALATTILLATVAPLLVWVVAVPLMRVDLVVDMGGGRPPQTISPGAIIVTAVVISLLAWALLKLLERVRGSADSAQRLWTIIALSVLVLSLFPLTSAVGVGAKLTLFAMHVAVGAVLLYRLGRAPTLGRAPSGAPST